MFFSASFGMSKDINITIAIAVFVDYMHRHTIYSFIVAFHHAQKKARITTKKNN